MQHSYTVFSGEHCLGSGSMAEVTVIVKTHLTQADMPLPLIFDDHSGQQVDIDLSADASASAEQPPRGKPGRPALGVIAREITLLPRHWDWLNAQPNGASATLRRLVESAAKADNGHTQVRQAQAALDRFMLAIAGDQPGYEDASRALYAGDYQRLLALCAAWPVDIRDYIQRKVSNLDAGQQLTND